MADSDVAGPVPEADDDLTPDPTFWGPTRPSPRGRHRRRPPGVGERVAAAIPSRDARTAIAAVVAVLTVTTVLVAYRAAIPTAAPAVTPPATAAPAPHRARPAGPGPRRVVVHVAGAVTHPGVVTLAGTDRVIDAIDTAGGARADANLDAVNLAARLRDGQQILVPATTATTTTPTAAGLPAAPPVTPPGP